MDLEQVALARRMDGVAERMRTAQRELGTVAAVQWQGLAAARFRERAADTGRDLAAVAAAGEDAAERWRQHAVAVSAAVVL
ncbi:hypothetical protein [Kineococcus sp. SYSU DK003]|uniref:hypothetical protein n=1 Tax=Kineococcus sp. SYSU DK003 TaxID=3383124 RepID=UPI003D7EF42F